jgi:mycothiol synthase
VEISELDSGLSADQIAGVLAVAAAATETDGVAPLSEQSLLSLVHPDVPAEVVHLLALVDGVIAGYAQIAGIPKSDEEPASGEAVIHPAYRHRGLGRRLVEAAFGVAESAGVPLAIWVHGDQPAALALGGSLGLARSRVLFKMCRPLADPLPPVRLPAGVQLRAFVPGKDEDAWLRVNSRAFVTHPEQGKWTMNDVLLREAEPWFDPAGFLLAVRTEGPEGPEGTETLLGFHWTKRHPGDVGEVYVLGVDPDAQGLRLGVALTLAGLEHLIEGGSTEAILYVDESNPRAVRLYSGLGFSVCATDVMYTR